jgi:hypothetical protein
MDFKRIIDFQNPISIAYGHKLIFVEVNIYTSKFVFDMGHICFRVYKKVWKP